MTKPVPEELERLASRLAMITSEDGEAVAAARAAGQLARRLGLSGGQIKAIFLAGVRSIASPRSFAGPDTFASPGTAVVVTPDPEAVGRAEREALDLRRLLDRTDDELRAAHRRLDSLHLENEELRDSLDRARSSGQVLRVLGGVLLAALLAGGGVAFYWAGLRLPDPPSVDGSPLIRMAAAGSAGVNVYAQPDRGSEQLARLPAGARLPVREIIWRDLAQWVQTEAAGRVGYAPATEVDLR